MCIGQKIRKEREKQGFSRDALVKKTDITVNTLYKIETGKMPNPSFEIIKKIANDVNLGLGFETPDVIDTCVGNVTVNSGKENYKIPKDGLCMIDDKTFSLRIIGCADKYQFWLYLG